jgi:transposase
MRKIREVLRLHGEAHLSARQIGKSCSISPTTATLYLNRAEAAGLSWPLPPELDDAALERLLFVSPLPADFPQRPLPDWVSIHQELKRKGVTLHLLWQEYKAQYPEGISYSQFCALYRRFTQSLDLALRQEHRAGEKLFVDFAGQIVSVVDSRTGEPKAAHIFVAVLGASNYTYALATWSEDLPSWMMAHVHAFEFLGGVPAIVVPDNLKSAVSKACRYEPDLNPTYQELARHYGTVVIPARVRKPRDKAKVEVGVLIVERWILAALRNRTFFTLAELNSAIRSLLVRLNDRPFKKLPGSRRLLFEMLDRPALRPLPQGRYEYAEWKKARVNIDYHIEVLGHYYSVPYALVHEQLDVRLTDRTVEIFHKGQRVASHPKSDHAGRHTTLAEHMPKSHQRYLEWTPSRLIHWAEKMGPATAQVVQTILSSRLHPEQGFRACLGILRLGKGYGQDRLEAACCRAIALKSFSYKSIESILKTGLDRRPLPSEIASTQTFEHENIRGPHYYQDRDLGGE